MASSIKYEDVKQDIEKDGWKLISTAYTNLKANLQLVCPEGHDCMVSYGKWRGGKYECPTCKENQYYNVDDTAVKKTGYRILVFDQASITSGWAVFDDEKLIKYGAHTSEGESSTEKIAKTKYWVASMIENWKPDEVVFEDIQLQKGTNTETFNGDMGVTTYKKLAHLQGVLMNYCYEKKVVFRIAAPATWRTHSDVKGRYRTDKKKSAQLKVKKFYDVSVTEDEADAILIGRWAAHIYGKSRIIDF